MGWASMTVNGTDSLLFINNVTANRGIRMNSEVYRAILSAHCHSNATKMVGWCFTVQMDFDPKRTVKMAEDVLQAEKWPSQSPDLNPAEQLFSY